MTAVFACVSESKSISILRPASDSVRVPPLGLLNMITNGITGDVPNGGLGASAIVGVPATVIPACMNRTEACPFVNFIKGRFQLLM